MSAPWKGAALAALVITLAAALAACGGSDSSTMPSAAKLARERAAETQTGYFSEESPWNTPIESLPKSPRSKQMLNLARRRLAVVELPDGKGYRTVERVVKKGFQINADRWAPLVVEAGGNNV